VTELDVKRMAERMFESMPEVKIKVRRPKLRWLELKRWRQKKIIENNGHVT
jgi:hypothetical protein